MKCEIAKEIPWFEYYCKIYQKKITPGSEFVVSVTFYVPKSLDASSLRIPFRLMSSDDDTYFGPRLLLEGSLFTSSTSSAAGRQMMPEKKFGYKIDVLTMLVRLAVSAHRQYGLYSDKIGKDTCVKDLLDRETFLKKLGTSLRYKLCMIPESFQISMMNTIQQFLMIDKNQKARETIFQTHKRRYGGSRWMFKDYDGSLSSWLFDLTTTFSSTKHESMRKEPTFTYAALYVSSSTHTHT